MTLAAAAHFPQLSRHSRLLLSTLLSCRALLSLLCPLLPLRSQRAKGRGRSRGGIWATCRARARAATRLYNPPKTSAKAHPSRGAASSQSTFASSTAPSTCVQCQRKESSNFDRRRVRKERRASSRLNAHQRPAGNVTSARGRLPASPPLRAAKLESCPQSHAVSASMEMRIRALDEDDRLHLVLQHTKDTMREIAVSTREIEHRGTEAVADICERGRAHARKQIQRARQMRRCTGASLACSRTRHAARGMRASKKMCLPVGPCATQAVAHPAWAALRLL